MREMDARLRWPGLEHPAVFLEEGWTQVTTGEELEFGFSPAITDAPPDGAQGLVVRGERLAGLRALGYVAPRSVDLAYFDVPRLAHARFAREHLRTATWLSMLRSHVGASRDLLSPKGTLVIHVDDQGAALAMAAMEDLMGRPADATVLWQKKYSAQNDLRGRIDDAQDYLLIFSESADATGALKTTWWPWQYAGKSEDATREAESLRDSGIVILPVIPKTSKPAKLVTRLLDAFTSEGDLLLECFSDTGFAAAAALAHGRRCVLLAGATAAERERAELCSVPRLQDAAGGKEPGVRVADVRGSGYTPAAVSAKNRPILVTRDHVMATSSVREVRPLRLEPTGDAAAPAAREGFPSMQVVADILPALMALEPTVQCDVRLAILSGGSAFGTGSPYASSTALMEMTSRLLDEQGVVAVECRPEMYGWVRLSGELDVFGLDQYLGTIARKVGESDYALHVLFKGLPHGRLGKIGLPKTRDYAAADGDPRGLWRAPGHKGARSGSRNTAFEYRLPPYRWELVSGELPPGVWRINPISGVIWAPRLEKPGEYRFRVRVRDSLGGSAEAECTIDVLADGTPSYPESVWWLEADELQDTGGKPIVVESQLPGGVLGEPYAAVLRARGGTPIDEKTAPGKPTDEGGRTRYWEFSYATLVGAILEDRAVFGKTGTARPSIKVYEDRETATRVPELSWWDAERLQEMSAEERLVDIFTEPGQLVLLAGGGSDPARQIIRAARRCVGIDEDGGALWSGYPFQARLGEVVGRWETEVRLFRPDYSAADFHMGLAWFLGYLPPEAHMGERLPPASLNRLTAVSPDGSSALAILDANEWPTHAQCAEIADALTPVFAAVQVLYYRGKPPRRGTGLAFRRIPFDLAGAR